jgi:transcription-repair coupling factor (superfamily II helicase)
MQENRFLSVLKNDAEAASFAKGSPLHADSMESLALAAYLSFSKKKQNLAIILPSLYDARSFIDFLSQFLPPEEILFFPYDEVLRIEAISSSKEMLKERVYSLSEAVSKRPHIFVANAVSLIHPLMSKERFVKSFLTLKKGQEFAPDKLVRTLADLGYSRVSKIEEVFQYSLRGEILDIFTPSSPDPYRLEYFDDIIDDIRVFSAASELSYKEATELTIIPGQENLFTPEEIEEGRKRIKASVDREIKLDRQETEELFNRTSDFLALVGEEGIDENRIRYVPFFSKEKHSPLEYLSSYRILFYRPKDIESVADNYYMEAVEYFDEIYKAHLSLKEEMSCFKLEEAVENITYEEVLDESSTLSVTDVPYHFVSVMDSSKMIQSFLDKGYGISVFLSQAKYSRFKEINEKAGTLIPQGPNYQEVVGEDISRGFILPAYQYLVLSAREIFGLPEGTSFFLKRFKEAKILTKYQDLTPGDYVVHEEQGIGLYRGIKTIDGLEYLTIEYAGDDSPKLYVPLEKYKLIRKYSGKDGLKPKLDHMGGATWARRKAKIRGRVAYLADRLLEIAAKRQEMPGFEFKEDEQLENLFAEAFPFQLTLAQQNAVQDIFKDMMSPHPMDRLLAGDVGFGKTEVAFRAVFKAVISGKQAALLCPTTVLANQHFEVALNRFNGFGVRIAMLSRNVDEKEQKHIIDCLKEGTIDFVIGTHRLLSDDVAFKNIGLLVVDEEQRFGVTHKEKIKENFSNIDVLTLTATPIPRTLQMSLLNVRSLSLLDDPPINRLPIKTYVVRYDKEMLREVIARELGRQGQVYYLHNRIQTIYKKAQEIQQMFPTAKIGVVHGQLEPDKMAEVMESFYSHAIDILICTTIIETGLDVPNCNTIIIEKAENFGLAQLYQIKGRVGRSSRLAYAYLTYPDYGVLNDESRKRLKALKDFTELGSGYKIATEDLNIRGAGDILGKEQAGFIDSIGYDAYMRLLKEVMQEKSLQDQAKPAKPTKTRYELSFSLDSHIPAGYASEADRINIYRELFDVATEEDLVAYERKIKDVYGHLPKEMTNLFLKKDIEIKLSLPIFESFKEYIDHYEIRMTKEYSCSYGIAQKLDEAFNKYDRRKVMPRFSSYYFSVIINKTSDYLTDLFDVVSTLLKLNKASKE